MDWLKGVSAFPITPQDSHGIVDTRALHQLVLRIADAGCATIGLLGSTGTYAYLSREQRRLAITAAIGALEVARKQKPSRSPKLIVGIGHVRTDMVVALARDAASAGADAGLLSPVSYTPLTEDEVFGLFATVAHEVPQLPLIIYHNQSTTRFCFTPQFVARLCRELPSVLAVKNPAPVDVSLRTHGELYDALKTLAPLRCSDFLLGYSVDSYAVEGLICGGAVWFSVVAGIIPKAASVISEMVLTGQHDDAREVHKALLPLLELMSKYSSIRVAHCAVEVLGLCKGTLPLPLLPLLGEARSEVVNALVAVRVALADCRNIDWGFELP